MVEGLEKRISAGEAADAASTKDLSDSRVKAGPTEEQFIPGIEGKRGFSQGDNSLQRFVKANADEFPPVQTFTVHKPAQGAEDGLTDKLHVTEVKRRQRFYWTSEMRTPVAIISLAGESQINDAVPCLICPAAGKRRVIGMKQENPHAQGGENAGIDF